MRNFEVADWNGAFLPDDDEDVTQTCDICGCYMDYVDCWQCLGEGGRDLYEENPLEYAPGEYETCSECKGEGGYLECSNAENHHKYLAAKERRA